jgi:hypothetical protein
MHVDVHVRWDGPTDLPSDQRRDRRCNVRPSVLRDSVPGSDLAPIRYDSALTDPLIAGIAKGSKAYKLVGSYVTSPLKWHVHRPVPNGRREGS